MSQFEEDFRNVYSLMVWEKNQIPEEEATITEEIIKIDPNPNIGCSLDKIAIIIVNAEDPLQGNPIVIFAHGNGELAIDYLPYQENFCPYGISICCVDYRGYGFSDGEFGTGGTEPDDIITVINYLKKHGYHKISFFGYSLGARCGIYAAAKFPDLTCVVLDSPYLSTYEWTKYKANFFENIDQERFEKVIPYVYEKIKEVLGIDFRQTVEASDVAHQIKQPFYLIHGKNDTLIPYSNSTELIEIVQSLNKIFKSYKFDHSWCTLRSKAWNDMFNFILKMNKIKVKK